MFRNYLITSWRNLFRNKAYSAINIGGLAIGITACLLILQYIAFETSYENFHKDGNLIYRVKQDRYNDGILTTEWSAGAFAAGNSFKERIPEIEDYVKVVENSDLVVDKGDETLKLEKVYYASESFFTMFSYPLISGDVNAVLKEPRTAAISESTANKVFNTTDVVGKTITFNGSSEYRITGVFKDMPNNTQLQPHVLLSYISFRERILAENDQNPDSDADTWWFSDGCLTYLKLKEGANPTVIESKFIPIVEELAGEDLREYNSGAVYTLIPLKDIHLYSNFMMEPSPTGDSKTVYLLFGIAFFIIILAWVNYINLATARAIGRAKEVGVRKAVGSNRKQLITQFFFESALFNGLALVVAFGLMIISIPAFNQLSGQELSYNLCIVKF